MYQEKPVWISISFDPCTSYIRRTKIGVEFCIGIESGTAPGSGSLTGTDIEDGTVVTIEWRKNRPIYKMKDVIFPAFVTAAVSDVFIDEDPILLDVHATPLNHNGGFDRSLPLRSRLLDDFTKIPNIGQVELNKLQGHVASAFLQG
ncbi:hypothetical protein EVAR_8075_1 [Eumeta japonica]|uniref:Uncharacterized protein n=1 Tax=Eumeta variegata TaxID=151549 RepID=A0A4C1TSL2_EUMVA|nr:hypothetical protein EVAR_8075_1 [Eumeta japonica]